MSIADLAPEVTDRAALLLGAEGPGLSAAALAAADLTVRIPMSAGVDSLNVAAAAAVAFYALGRCRNRRQSEPAVARLGHAVGAEADQAERRRDEQHLAERRTGEAACSATSKPCALPGWWSMAALTTRMPIRKKTAPRAM